MNTGCRGRVVVVGSANVDFVVPVARLPFAGETVLGGDCHRLPGGKGANQAVAAARLGADVALVGRVGDDDSAALLLDAVRMAGVDSTHLQRTIGVPTGMAVITVAADGDNTITVSAGSNSRLHPDDIVAVERVLATSAVTMLQLEIPLETVVAAAAAASGLVLLNPAPAVALPAALLERVDVLVPNSSELGTLLGAPEPKTVEEAVLLARQITGPAAVVVTLGANGAVVVHDGVWTHVPAIEADVVDATGAGDTFCGAMAEALARDCDLLSAVHWAVRAAAISTTRFGAQTAMPTADEVERMSARAVSGG